MNAKTLTTVVLLLFVAASVVYLIVGEAAAPSTATPSTTTAPAADQAATSAPADRVVAYYFHNHKRCATCLKIERQAEEALREEFPGAFESGRLEWRAVNMQEPPNEHFIEDYELVTSSLVIVDIEDGAKNDWQRMDKVWELVNDPLNFHVYVVGQAHEYLGS